MRDDHAPDAELVARLLRGEVEEWPYDVAGAVPEVLGQYLECFVELKWS